MKPKKHEETEGFTWNVYDSSEKLLYTAEDPDKAVEYMEAHPEAATMRSNLKFSSNWDELLDELF